MRLARQLFITAAVLISAPAPSQPTPVASPSALTYADLADLALSAPVVAHVRLARSTALKASETGPVRAGLSRHYVEADVISLIQGAQGLPARISYLADVPLGPNGKPAKLAKKSEHIVLAQAVPGRPGEVRLVAPDAQIPFSSALAAQVRTILRDASAASAPPRITGIGRAFHVRGSLPGESETQIFLQTADERPVSLSVIRRPGETPRWAVALSEIVDDAARAPAPATLLWYRLACSLPPALPEQSYAEASGEERAAMEADYRLVIAGLGSCARSRR